jgi:hypothetical protein
MKMKIIETENKYYYTEDLKKGVELFSTPKDGYQEILLGGYEVTEIKDRYFYLENNWLKKGIPVEINNCTGILVDYSERFAVVNTGGVRNKVLHRKDLHPVRLDVLLKSLAIARDIKETVNEEERKNHTFIYKSFISRINKGFDYELDAMKGKIPKTGFTEQPESSFKQVPQTPSIEKVPEVKQSFGSKLKNLVTGLKSSGTETINKPLNPAVMDLDTGKVARLDKSKETPSSSNILSHISLNNNSKSETDRYNYHYKKGNSFTTSTTPLDESGNPTIDHPALKGKIFLPGEKVEHQGKEYTVHSHINPLPAENGLQDYNKMLVKDKTGNLFSVNRANVKQKGIDFAKSEKVTLDNGTKKYHHELKKGDVIMKDGKKHDVTYADSQGHITARQGDNKLYYTDAADYDKPFKHNEYNRNKVAEKGDVIEFNHLGAKKYREVLAEHPEGAIVQVNKSDEPFLVKHDDYKFTGEKGHEKISENLKRNSKPSIETSSEEQPTMEIDELKRRLAQTESPETQSVDMKNHLDKLNNLVPGEHNREKIGENKYNHKLGVGDVGIESEYDPETNQIKKKITNPEFTFPNKSLKKKEGEGEEDFAKRQTAAGKKFKVVDVDLKNGELHIAPMTEFGVEKSPNGKIKGLKIVNINDFKNSQSQNYQPDVSKLGKEKEKLVDKLAELHQKHNVPDINKDYNEESLYKHENDIGKDIHDAVNKYGENVNKINRGTGLTEPPDYKPVNHNYEKNGSGELDKILSDDKNKWHEKVADRIKVREKEESDKKQAEQNLKEATETRKNLKQEQTKAVEENKKQEQKPVTDYIKDVYNKISPLKERSINGKLGIDLGKTKLSMKNKDFDNTDAEWHLIDLSKGDTINSHNPTEAHFKRADKAEKIPFIKNEQFPQTSLEGKDTQIKNYHDLGTEGEANRKFTLDVADKFKKEEAINTSPQAMTNTSVVGEKGDLMAGRNRDNSKKLLSPEQIADNKKYLKETILPQMPNFDKLSEEQKNNLHKEIDGAGNPDLVRMAIHKDGTPYNFGKHNEDYTKLTAAMDKDVTKTLSKEAQNKMLQSSLTEENRSKLFNMIPKGTTINRHLNEPKNAIKMIDELNKMGVVSDDEKMNYYNDKEGLTPEGKEKINEIFKGGYFSKGTEDLIDKLPEKEKRQILEFKNNHIKDLIDLKTNNPYYDLKPDIEQVIKDKNSGKKELKGQDKLYEESTPVKGIKFIMDLPADEQKEAFKKYQESVDNLKNAGDSLYAGTITDEEKDIKKFKNNFFKRYADFYDFKKNQVKKSFYDPIENNFITLLV